MDTTATPRAYAPPAQAFYPAQYQNLGCHNASQTRLLHTAYLAAAILDLAWHSLDANATVADVEEFEAKAIEAYGLNYSPVPTRYRSTYFSHIFAGGYSAGYYGYIWSEVLDADTVDWFKENGGLTRANGDHFRNTLLSRGGSINSMQMFRNFRGRDATIEPLLKRRGLL